MIKSKNVKLSTQPKTYLNFLQQSLDEQTKEMSEQEFLFCSYRPISEQALKGW